MRTKLNQDIGQVLESELYSDVMLISDYNTYIDW